MANEEQVRSQRASIRRIFDVISTSGGASTVDLVLYSMLIFVPIAFIVGFAQVGGLWEFLTSALAIVPMAKLLGTATEELAARVGSGLGGLLNATFGNATELIIAFFALQAGLTTVVKASITGSIIGNLLFVLGLSIVAGGARREKQTFNATAASASSSQMTVAVAALIIPAVFVAASATTSHSAATLEGISLAVAAILLLTYLAQLLFSLRTHAHLYHDEAVAEVGSEVWSVRKALAILGISAIIIGFLSEFLVQGVEYLTSTLGWSELFVGVILVAIVGNAAEHMSAVTVALKDRMNLSMSIALGSSTQIALFVAPALVFIGFLMGGNSQLTLLFHPVEIVAIALAVLIVDIISRDGESNWLEGVQLLAVYAILAVAFFVLE